MLGEPLLNVCHEAAHTLQGYFYLSYSMVIEMVVDLLIPSVVRATAYTAVFVVRVEVLVVKLKVLVVTQEVLVVKPELWS